MTDTTQELPYSSSGSWTNLYLIERAADRAARGCRRSRDGPTLPRGERDDGPSIGGNRVKSPQRHPAALLIAVLILTGCSTPTESSNPSCLSRSALTCDATSPLVESTTNETTPDPRSVPVAWDGRKPTYLEACLPQVPDDLACRALGGGYAVSHVFPAGNLTWADLTLTWQASSPLTRELRFSVFAASTCGPDCDTWERVSPWAVGPSPLVVQSPLDATQNATVRGAIVVAPLLYAVPPHLYVAATTDQLFHVQGTLLMNETTASGERKTEATA